MLIALPNAKSQFSKFYERYHSNYMKKLKIYNYKHNFIQKIYGIIDYSINIRNCKKK